MTTGGIALRDATVPDSAELAALNARLIVEEGHRNTMTTDELEARMREWLSNGYRAIVATREHRAIGYVLARDAEYETLYIRQLFVAREDRRRGIGRQLVMAIAEFAVSRRIRIDVLVGNAPALAFWRSIGFVDYALSLERAPDATTSHLHAP